LRATRFVQKNGPRKLRSTNGLVNIARSYITQLDKPTKACLPTYLMVVRHGIV